MPSTSSSLRTFISRVSRAFHSANRTFANMLARWKSAVTSLGQRIRSLANEFFKLKTKRVIGSAGEELCMLGYMEGGEFSRMLRAARSVEAFERATRATLTKTMRASFRHLDDIAALHFPDVSLLRRKAYVTEARKAMIARKMISKSDRIMEAAKLEQLIRSDPKMLSRANALLKKTSYTRKLLYLGGVITVAGVGLSYLSHVLTKHAANHTGCFMYTRDLANNVSKCRISGCSCPLSLSNGENGNGDDKQYVVATCFEDDLWSKMHFRNSDCGSADAANRAAPFCVHCNWDEKDNKNVDFVDRDQLPDNAYVACEKMDALDAFNEVVGHTVDNAFGAGNKLANYAKDIMASSADFLPWIPRIILCVIAIAVLLFVWRIWRAVKGGGESNDIDDNDDESYHHHHHHHHEENDNVSIAKPDIKDSVVSNANEAASKTATVSIK